MLEERTEFTCVGFIQLSDGLTNSLYMKDGGAGEIYRDDVYNGIVYEISEIQGSSLMTEVNEENLSKFVNTYYNTGMRGAIPLSNGKMIGIYMDDHERYYCGTQSMGLYSTQKPDLHEIDIDVESELITY